ncbi:conjugative transfer protein [Escherichia coli O111:H11 str. CFSAN001630]|nr:conjugative transfer protein [Escherichia coli O111:H11 str. CFSAN001630]
MNEVYVIAGGEWLRNNLNAIAAFMSTRTWDSIEKIALTLSVVAVAFMWVQRHNVMDLLGWVAVFVLISLLVNVRTSVQIIDNSDLVKVHRVDNVPVGLAMPLSLTTRIGHAMVVSYEMIFTQPDSVNLSKDRHAVRGESDCEKHRFPVPESGNHQSVPGLRPELRAG